MYTYVVISSTAGLNSNRERCEWLKANHNPPHAATRAYSCLNRPYGAFASDCEYF